MSHDLRVERVIDATPEEVFDAFTDTKAQLVWMRHPADPDGILETESDPVVGGRWVATWGPSRDELYHEVNVYEVVDRPNRVVMATTMTGPDGSSLDTRTEVRFEEADGKTRMTVLQSGFPTPEIRDFARDTAWPGAFFLLERYFEMRKESA